MKVKKASKLKSAGRIKYYKTFGWLGHVAYRLRGDSVIRKYLETGKYVQTYGEVYELIPGHKLLVKDIFISSTVKRSRVKNKRDGCICVFDHEQSE